MSVCTFFQQCVDVIERDRSFRLSAFEIGLTCDTVSKPVGMDVVIDFFPSAVGHSVKQSMTALENKKVNIAKLRASYSDDATPGPLSPIGNHPTSTPSISSTLQLKLSHRRSVGPKSLRPARMKVTTWSSAVAEELAMRTSFRDCSSVADSTSRSASCRWHFEDSRRARRMCRCSVFLFPWWAPRVTCPQNTRVARRRVQNRRRCDP